MLVESLVERALTGLLGEQFSERGSLFFEALASSGMLPPEEVEELEREWRELVRRRVEESGEAQQALAEFALKLRAAVGAAAAQPTAPTGDQGPKGA
jgi:hypothetical protein